ncbi:hypothetical protein VHAB30_14990 [Variovorax boronicumulans]|nr:hypothetical protein VHAB30_14990 [Variovorax boronicumulans]
MATLRGLAKLFGRNPSLQVRSEETMKWSPISAVELEALVGLQLSECTLREREIFAQYRIPFRLAAIERSGEFESVFVVAMHRSVAMYFEDVEEGFNLSPLRSDGSIARPGWQQWSLQEALNGLVFLQPE